MANVSKHAGNLADGDIVDGKYRIVRYLGQGAWATVYEGVNVRIGRRVAIKVLGEDAIHKPGVVERFEREAQSATRIESDHVVHVFDLGVLPDGRPYIVMELLEGEDLAHQIAAMAPLPERRVVFYGIQAARGLADAHAAGVMHRDVKPDNIFLVKTKAGDEVIKIVDFGISKLHSGTQVTSMTQTNAVLGSPVYMSPEQCRSARSMDHRSDIYSLGVVLFELLTGRVPHTADTFNELMFKIALEDAKSPLTIRPDIDEELGAIVVKALARDANARYQTANELEQVLVEWGKKHGLGEVLTGRRGKMRITDPPKVSAPPGFRGTTLSAGAMQVPDRGPLSNAQTMEMSAAPKRSRWVVGGVAGALVLAIGAFVVARPHRGASVDTATALAPPAALTTAPPPAATTVSPTAESNSPPTSAAENGANVPAPTPSVAESTSAAARAGGVTAPPTPHGARKVATPPVVPPPKTTVAAAAPPAPPAAAEPPPSPANGPAKSVVDGRTIRTEF